MNIPPCAAEVTGHSIYEKCENVVSTRVDIGQKWREDKGRQLTERCKILLQNQGENGESGENNVSSEITIRKQTLFIFA